MNLIPHHILYKSQSQSSEKNTTVVCIENLTHYNQHKHVVFSFIHLCLSRLKAFSLILIEPFLLKYDTQLARTQNCEK